MVTIHRNITYSHEGSPMTLHLWWAEHSAPPRARTGRSSAGFAAGAGGGGGGREAAPSTRIPVLTMKQSAIKCHGGEHSNCLTSTITQTVSIGEIHFRSHLCIRHTNQKHQKLDTQYHWMLSRQLSTNMKKCTNWDGCDITINCCQVGDLFITTCILN